MLVHPFHSHLLKPGKHKGSCDGANHPNFQCAGNWSSAYVCTAGCNFMLCADCAKAAVRFSVERADLVTVELDSGEQVSVARSCVCLSTDVREAAAAAEQPAADTSAPDVPLTGITPLLQLWEDVELMMSQKVFQTLQPKAEVLRKPPSAVTILEAKLQTGGVFGGQTTDVLKYVQAAVDAGTYEFTLQACADKVGLTKPRNLTIRYRYEGESFKSAISDVGSTLTLPSPPDPVSMLSCPKCGTLHDCLPLHVFLNHPVGVFGVLFVFVRASFYLFVCFFMFVLFMSRSGLWSNGCRRVSFGHAWDADGGQGAREMRFAGHDRFVCDAVSRLRGRPGHGHTNAGGRRAGGLVDCGPCGRPGADADLLCGSSDGQRQARG